MKFLRVLVFLTVSTFFMSSGTVFALEEIPNRPDRVSEIHAKYDPLYDAQYARLLVIRSKILNDASMLPSFKLVMVDFREVRRLIDESLNSATSDLDSVVAYADEELGEFENTLYLLQKQLATHRTITCVKGKTVKKVMGLKPTCPKGSKQKK